MAFTVQLSTDSQAISNFGGSSNSGFMNTTGIYENVTINFVSAEATTNGAVKLNLNVKYNGNDIPLYGPTIQNRDGKPNTIGMQVLNKLAVIIQ